MKKAVIVILYITSIAACTYNYTKEDQSNNNFTKRTNNVLSKFEPEKGKCLFFVGQDLGAVGGLEGYNDGYCDYFDIPAGVTVYTNFSPVNGEGHHSYGHYCKGMDGVLTMANWGAGDCRAQSYIESKKFQHSLMAIGLSFVKNEKKIAQGKLDSLIVEMGKWIKSLGKRPVFLRLGYEFDGWAWNNYDREYYLESWKRVRHIYDSMEIKNIAYVWQSKGTETTQEELEEWYPGDDMVDWCGYTYFAAPDMEMVHFARKHNKPVFIAELTPNFVENGIFLDTDLKKPTIAKKAWDKWFSKFFKFIKENDDVIKAFSYINVNWPSQLMWKDNPNFQQIDSRIQMSNYISKRWAKEISNERYLRPTPKLWGLLWNNNQKR